MAIYVKTVLILIFAISTPIISAQAEPQNDRWDYPSQKEFETKREQVQLEGILLPEEHKKGEEDFDIEFVSADGTHKYDVSDSPEVTNLIRKNESSYIVKIDGELTPRFLFWGGDLVVKSFEILGKRPAPSHLVVSSSTRDRFPEGRR